MVEWIAALVERGGPAAVALLMFVENLFPPIPSELIMPLAGFMAARGETPLGAVIAAGTAGSLAGALFWYWVGRCIGEARFRGWTMRHGRWLALSPAEADRACAWFRRHGGLAVLTGRLVPAVRTLISLPAGIARMKLAPFLLYSSLGTVLWTALLALAGWALESRYRQVAAWAGPAADAVLGAVVLFYLYRVVTFPRKGR